MEVFTYTSVLWKYADTTRRRRRRRRLTADGPEVHSEKKDSAAVIENTFRSFILCVGVKWKGFLKLKKNWHVCVHKIYNDRRCVFDICKTKTPYRSTRSQGCYETEFINIIIIMVVGFISSLSAASSTNRNHNIHVTPPTVNVRYRIWRKTFVFVKRDLIWI